jgi:hypothetical protein
MHIGGIFCDLAKTSECVNHKMLLTKLLFFFRIQGATASWLKSFLTENKKLK